MRIFYRQISGKNCVNLSFRFSLPARHVADAPVTRSLAPGAAVLAFSVLPAAGKSMTLKSIAGIGGAGQRLHHPDGRELFNSSRKVNMSRETPCRLICSRTMRCSQT